MRSVKILSGLAFVLFAVGALGVWQYGGVAFAKRSEKPYQSRPKAGLCAAGRPAGKLSGRDGECKKDSDCTAGKNGRCQAADYSGGRVAPKDRCSYDQCFADKDCGDKSICLCGHESTGEAERSQAHVCVDAECKVDADCGAGQFCSPSQSLCGRGGGNYGHYYCHTSRDECMIDDDCPRPTKQTYGPTDVRCSFSTAARRWECMSQECPVG